MSLGLRPSCLVVSDDDIPRADRLLLSRLTLDTDGDNPEGEGISTHSVAVGASFSESLCGVTRGVIDAAGGEGSAAVTGGKSVIFRLVVGIITKGGANKSVLGDFLIV